MKYRKLILAQLRRDNPGVPERVLGLLADKLVATVTAEDQIEGAIAELVESMPISIKEFSDFVQREGDRRVTEATGKPKSGKTGDEDPATGDEQSTTEMGELKKMIATLSQTVTGLVKEKTTQTIQSKMEAQLTEKKIPLVFLKGRVPATEDEIEIILSEIEADWGTISQGTSTQKLNSFKPPVAGARVVEGQEEVVDSSVSDYVKRKVEAAGQASK